MDEWAKAEVNQIRPIVQKIKACPQRTVSASKGATFIEGPPYNVTWDVVASKSICAPYAGYIELIVALRVVANDEQCKKSHTDCSALASSMDSRPPMVLRYEYDLAPDGLNLVKALARGENENKWVDRAMRGDSCWEGAAKP